MKTETLPTTTTTNTPTWTEIREMALDKQGEALAAMGFADAGHATDEDTAYSVNYWLAKLMACKPNRGNHLLYVARALFIFEQEHAEPKAQ